MKPARSEDGDQKEAIAGGDLPLTRASDSVLPSGSIVVEPFTMLTGEAAEIQSRAIAALQQDLQGFKDRYLQRFKRVLNSDNSSELWEDYAKSEANRAKFGLAVRAPASALIRALYVDLLAKPTPAGHSRVVVFTAGGNGAGKSTGAAGRKPDIVFDSTLSSVRPSEANVQAALNAGRDVVIRYMWRDPERALVAGALGRAMDEGKGRVVTIRSVAATHIGSRETVLQLADRYVDDPRVKIFIFENDESGDRRQRDVAWLKEQHYDDRDVLERPLHAALDAVFQAGDISADVYEGTRGIAGRD